MTSPQSSRPAWLDDFSIPRRASGAVLAVDFDDDGVWMARLTSKTNVSSEITECRISPAVLDVRVASRLRDTGAVPEATDPGIFTELLTLCTQARETLARRDSAMLMGDEHLRLVTVSLDEMMIATMPEVNRVHGMIAELADRDPVDAVFLGPGTDAWPGLWESLSARGFAMLTPGDPFPTTFGGDESDTGILEQIDSGAVTALAWAATTDEDEDGALAPTRSPAARPHARRGKAVMAAAAAGVLAVVGAGIAVATMSHQNDQQLPTASFFDDDGPARTTTAEAPGPTTAEPADIKAARATMNRYQPPTPTRTTETKVTEAPTGPQPRPEPKPTETRRTIPNPIPGLPPIIIG